MTIKPPVIWCVGGSDSSAHAGLQAYLRTGQDLGCHVQTIVTCITAQNSKEVQSVEAVSLPARLTGRPTSSSNASYSDASAVMRAMDASFRGTVSTGTASRPSGTPTAGGVGSECHVLPPFEEMRVGLGRCVPKRWSTPPTRTTAPFGSTAHPMFCRTGH